MIYVETYLLAWLLNSGNLIFKFLNTGYLRRRALTTLRDGLLAAHSLKLPDLGLDPELNFCA